MKELLFKPVGGGFGAFSYSIVENPLNEREKDGEREIWNTSDASSTSVLSSS